MSESYPSFYTSTSSLCVSVKWRRRWDWRQEACCWYTSPLRPPPPPLPPPLPLITATTLHHVVGSSSIRNDEDSADLTKSFQELSRRLPVLVNSGHRLGSFNSLNRVEIPLPDYFEILISSSSSSLFLLLFFFSSQKCELCLFIFFLSFFVSWSLRMRKCVNAEVCPWGRHTEAACLPQHSRPSCFFYFSVVPQMLSK